MKSLPVVFAALFVVAGCVSVGPNASSAPTPAASSVPSLGVTTPAPATLPPTVAPIPTPTPEHTDLPTLPPTTPPPIATPTAVLTEPPVTEPPASTGPSSAPATRDQIFADDFSDSSSGWTEADLDYVSIHYDTGALALRFDANPAWAYSGRQLGGEYTTVVQAAEFLPQSDGVFGLLCGDGTGPTMYGAVVNTDGGLVFIQIVNGQASAIDRHDNLGLDVQTGDSNPLALECSVDVDGVVTLVAGLSGTGPVAVYSTPAGLSSFNAAGLYGESSSDNYTLAVTNAAAWGTGGSTGTMSDGAQALWQHIPTDLQNNCYESPVWNTDAQFVVSCIEQTKGKGAEILQYKQYADAAGMSAEYQSLVDAFGVDSTGSCKTGANEDAWQDSDGTVGGRVQCAPQFVGIRFDWTDDLTNVLSSLIDLDGSYKDTYDQWVNAGPIIPQ